LAHGALRHPEEADPVSLREIENPIASACANADRELGDVRAAIALQEVGPDASDKDVITGSAVELVAAAPSV
jgi:hypothetical protein